MKMSSRRDRTLPAAASVALIGHVQRLKRLSICPPELGGKFCNSTAGQLEQTFTSTKHDNEEADFGTYLSFVLV